MRKNRHLRSCKEASSEHLFFPLALGAWEIGETCPQVKESRTSGDSLASLSRKINLEEEEDVGELADDSELLTVEEFGRR